MDKNFRGVTRRHGRIRRRIPAWCRMRAHAKGKGDCICFKAIKSSRKEIPDSRPGLGDGGVHFKDLEALPVWCEMYYLHQP